MEEREGREVGPDAETLDAVGLTRTGTGEHGVRKDLSPGLL